MFGDLEVSVEEVVALDSSAGRCGPPTGPARPRPGWRMFSLLLGSSTLERLCELENGQVVAPGALRRWLTDADVERILFEGDTGRVIDQGPEESTWAAEATGPLRRRKLIRAAQYFSYDLSRKRDFTGALRRLIQVRDRVCYHRTCDEPGSRCEVDHVIPWAAGGMTTQSNGRLACGFHNRLRNQPPAPSPSRSGGGDGAADVPAFSSPPGPPAPCD